MGIASRNTLFGVAPRQGGDRKFMLSYKKSGRFYSTAFFLDSAY